MWKKTILLLLILMVFGYAHAVVVPNTQGLPALPAGIPGFNAPIGPITVVTAPVGTYQTAGHAVQTMYPSYQYGSLAVNSIPAGAAIFLDRRDTGVVTPQTFTNLTRGDHILVLKYAGYQELSKIIRVYGGQTTTVNLSLTPIRYGNISIASNPAGAEVWLDRMNTGTTTPIILENCTPGEHTLLLHLDGYYNLTRVVRLGQGQSLSVNTSLVQINYGNISVTTNPTGAIIWLDRVNTGRVSPYVFENLTPGDHSLLLQRDGYYNVSRPVRVYPGQTNAVNATLKPILYGNVSVSTTPPGAQIWVDRVNIGAVTPNIIENLTQGDHIIQLKLAGYRDYSRTFRVAGGQTFVINTSLIALYGNVTVISNPAGAQIWIDRANTGTITPGTIQNLTIGEHSLNVKFAGYRDGVRTFRVPGGGTETVYVSLVPFKYGNISITSNPTGAHVWFDRANTGAVTPYTIENVTEGQHTIVLQRDGYYNLTRQLWVAQGQAKVLNETLNPLQQGNISVLSVPSGAKIWLDSISTGKVTPTTLEAVNAGNHFVLLQLNGYNYYYTFAKVITGQTTIVNATLVPGGVPGYISVTSLPPGAAIWLDGSYTLKNTPDILRQIKPGEHRITLKKTGYIEYSTNVTVIDNSLSTVNVTLTKNT